MKLIPYITSRKITQTGFVLVGVKILCGDGGQGLWTIEEENLSEKEIRINYCEENGIFVKKVYLKNGEAWIEVSEKTRISDFYSYDELGQNMTQECWRTFYVMWKNGESGGESGGKDGKEEYIFQKHLLEPWNKIVSEVLRLADKK